MQSFCAEESMFEPPPSSRLYIPGKFESSPSPLSRSDMSISQPPTQMSLPSSANPSYQSLFVPGTEIPRFQVPYRWWEDEATTVLWAFNFPEISQVIRYRLFRDENFPRTSLMNRNADAIEAFLISLCDSSDQQLLMGLSHMQRVEEILRRSSIVPFRPIAWSWFPPLPGHSLDARSIADAIEAESHFQFSRMEFEEIVRASLGYSAPSVGWFLLQHTALYIHLMDHLHAYPEEIAIYLEVEKHLRSRSPFANRALVHCLHSVLPRTVNTIGQSKKPGFEFIAGPIQTLFKDDPPSLTMILKILSVLAVRFRRQYIHSPKMDWNTPFDTSYMFLEDCVGSISPKDLARTLTGTDEISLASLSHQSIVTGDAAVKEMLSNWHALSSSVWECCTALPDVISYLAECVQALLIKRNYHSLTALLNGIHKYAVATSRSRGLNSTVGGMVVLDPLLPTETLFITNPAENYAAYRQHYRENPGIPFLFPHLREYRQHGDAALQPLLNYLHNLLAARA